MGCRIWLSNKGGRYSGKVAYRCLKGGGGIFRKGGVDSGRVA